MRAAQLDQFGDPTVLTVREMPTPRPAAGEVLIRVAASSVNPVDALASSPGDIVLVPGATAAVGSLAVQRRTRSVRRRAGHRGHTHTRGHMPLRTLREHRLGLATPESRPTPTLQSPTARRRAAGERMAHGVDDFYGTSEQLPPVGVRAAPPHDRPSRNNSAVAFWPMVDLVFGDLRQLALAVDVDERQDILWRGLQERPSDPVLRHCWSCPRFARSRSDLTSAPPTRRTPALWSLSPAPARPRRGADSGPVPSRRRLP